jgi:uncharacterized membrane protein YbhN (UPF0104 family)
MGIFFKKYREGKYEVYEVKNSFLYSIISIVLIVSFIISLFIRLFTGNLTYFYITSGMGILFILADADLFVRFFSRYFKKIKIIKEGKLFGKIRYKFEV